MVLTSEIKILSEINKSIRARLQMIDIKELQEIAEKYGFKNPLEFALWVEDNGLGEILFGQDQEDIESGKEEIDKDSMKYRSTTLALDILSLPEVKNKNLDNVTFDQWLKWSRKAKNSKKK